MTKLYPAFLLLLLLSLCAGSCQKETSAIPADLQLPAITGKWYLKSLVIKTSTDTSVDVTTETYTSFTTNDFFEFKASNAATYSSSIIGKMYNGYYSAEAAAIPQTLTFKSGDFVNKYIVNTATADNLIIYQTSATKSGTVTTTVTDTYTYSKK